MHTRADFETRHGRQSRADLKIPVQLGFAGSILGGGVDDVVVIRVVQFAVKRTQCVMKSGRQILFFRVIDGSEIRLVNLRHDPDFKGNFSRIGDKRQECLILQDNARSLFALVFQDVAIDASAPLVEIALRPLPRACGRIEGQCPLPTSCEWG